MFYFLATYQIISISAINMAIGLMYNRLGGVSLEDLEDILNDDEE